MPSFWEKPLFRLISFVIIIILIPLSFYLFKYLTTPRPGNCLILQEKYCKLVQFINDPNAPEGLLAAYKIPTGAPIFAPSEGELSKTPKFLFKDETGNYIGYPGITITTYADRATNNISEKYSFIFFKGAELNTIPSNMGNTIGIISDKNIDQLGNFNLLVRISKSNSEGKLIYDPVLLKITLRPKK